jgi:hypothetical protein
MVDQNAARRARDRARLTTMPRTHVRNFDRRSKRARERGTASHASWTTSSAMARCGSRPDPEYSHPFFPQALHQDAVHILVHFDTERRSRVLSTGYELGHYAVHGIPRGPRHRLPQMLPRD